MRDAHMIGYLLLCHLLFPAQPKSEGDNVLLSGGELSYGVLQELPVYICFDRAHHCVAICTQNIAEQQLLSIPIRAQGLVKASSAIAFLAAA